MPTVVKGFTHTPVHCCPTETGALTAAETHTPHSRTRGTVLEMKFSYLPADVATESLFTFMQA